MKDSAIFFPDAEILFGDRVLLRGKNGSGKSTLIKILLGEISADSGQLIRGQNVKIGYIPQERKTQNDGLIVLDFMEENTGLNKNEIFWEASKFRLSAEDLKKTIANLSPGEYSRLLIAVLMMQKPNCIILDEPTNHLDLEVCEELEQALKNFKGTLIVASHDRYFCEKVGFTKFFDL